VISLEVMRSHGILRVLQKGRQYHSLDSPYPIDRDYQRKTRIKDDPKAFGLSK
jgi:hypothetical protein